MPAESVYFPEYFADLYLNFICQVHLPGFYFQLKMFVVIYKDKDKDKDKDTDTDKDKDKDKDKD